VRDANQAMELVKSNFYPQSINGCTYWLTNDVNILRPSATSVYLLPAYDEFILSYTDRSASIPTELEQHMKAISDRGVFRPIIVINGQVHGIWKRTINKDTMLVEIQPFSKVNPFTMDLIEQAASRFGYFLGKKIDLKP
jgi:hypothetical protein